MTGDVDRSRELTSAEMRNGRHCITCGDDGVPMRVLRVDEARGLALCEGPDGKHSTVETALVAPVAAGDTLLVHAGTALAQVAAA